MVLPTPSLISLLTVSISAGTRDDTCISAYRSTDGRSIEMMELVIEMGIY